MSNTEKDELREIPGFPGYFASSRGRIFSSRTGRMVELKARLHKGYLHVFAKTGIGRHTKKKMPVHRLVLLAFKGYPPSAEHESRHLNGDALDNRESNLAWGTAKENAADQERHGTAVWLRRGSAHPAAKLTESDVLAIRREARGGTSHAALAARFGVSASHVGDIVAERAWQHLRA